MKKILIADDRFEIRELVRMTLSSDKYEMFFAENGQEAIELAEKNNPDLILMDIMMPVLDGLEATKKLKSCESTKNCNIIMLTAMGQKTDIKKGINNGADDYIVKPFSPLNLIKAINKVFGEE